MHGLSSFLAWGLSFDVYPIVWHVAFAFEFSPSLSHPPPFFCLALSIRLSVDHFLKGVSHRLSVSLALILYYRVYHLTIQRYYLEPKKSVGLFCGQRYSWTNLLRIGLLARAYALIFRNKKQTNTINKRKKENSHLLAELHYWRQSIG